MKYYLIDVQIFLVKNNNKYYKFNYREVPLARLLPDDLLSHFHLIKPLRLGNKGRKEWRSTIKESLLVYIHLYFRLKYVTYVGYFKDCDLFYSYSSDFVRECNF